MTSHIETPLDDLDTQADATTCEFAVTLPAQQAEQFELLLEQVKRLGNVQTNASAVALMTEWYLIPDRQPYDQPLH